jgi:hypothetical protein
MVLAAATVTSAPEFASASAHTAAPRPPSAAARRLQPVQVFAATPAQSPAPVSANSSYGPRTPHEPFLTASASLSAAAPVVVPRPPPSVAVQAPAPPAAPAPASLVELSHAISGKQAKLAARVSELRAEGVSESAPAWDRVRAYAAHVRMLRHEYVTRAMRWLADARDPSAAARALEAADAAAGARAGAAGDLSARVLEQSAYWVAGELTLTNTGDISDAAAAAATAAGARAHGEMAGNASADSSILPSLPLPSWPSSQPARSPERGHSRGGVTTNASPPRVRIYTTAPAHGDGAPGSHARFASVSVSALPESVDGARPASSPPRRALYRSDDSVRVRDKQVSGMRTMSELKALARGATE